MANLKNTSFVRSSLTEIFVFILLTSNYCLPVYVFIFKPGFKLDGSDRADFGAPTSPTSNRRFDILLFDLKYFFQLHRQFNNLLHFTNVASYLAARIFSAFSREVCFEFSLQFGFNSLG